jgi:hypothetical protein
MRRIAIIAGFALVVAACEKSENAGAEEARKEAEREAKERASRVEPAKKISPPVPNSGHISCATLIDLPKYQAALGEKEPLSIKDQTKGEPEAAASCGIVRGGKRPKEAEQQATLKKDGRLGVMPQDVICDVTAFCWTIESIDTLKKRCTERKEREDDSMGSFACVQIVATGAFDVQVFRFFDEDTKCILQVRGGASQTDNDIIRKCAVTARDSIGPQQIVPGEPAPAAPSGSGSGSGSGAGSGP